VEKTPGEGQHVPLEPPDISLPEADAAPHARRGQPSHLHDCVLIVDNKHMSQHTITPHLEESVMTKQWRVRPPRRWSGGSGQSVRDWPACMQEARDTGLAKCSYPLSSTIDNRRANPSAAATHTNGLITTTWRRQRKKGSLALPTDSPDLGRAVAPPVLNADLRGD